MTVDPTTFDDDGLRAFWSAADALPDPGRARTFFQSYVWNRTWWEHFGTAQRAASLRLLAVRDGSDIVAVAPLYAQRRSIGTLTAWEHVLWIGYDLAPYQNIVVSPDVEQDAWRAILAWCAREHPRAWLQLADLPRESALSGLTVAGWEISSSDGAPNLRLDFERDAPRKLETYLRPAARRAIRQARRASAGDTSVEWRFSRGMRPQDMDDLIALNRRRFGTRSFFEQAAHREFFRALVSAADQRVCLSTLTRDLQPVHMIVLFEHGSTLYYFLSGMSPAAHAINPGFLNFARLLEFAIDEGYAAFDFLRGNERYKSDLGGTESRARDVTAVPRAARSSYAVARASRLFRRVISGGRGSR